MTPRFAYLLLCHTDPDGVLRLVRRIRDLSPRSSVLVRYDDPALFAPGEVEAAGGVPFCSSVDVHWGEWSQARMQLEVLREATTRVPADRYVLISGQDYPIRDLAAWEAELVADGADAFLDPMSPQPKDYEFRWRTCGEAEALPPFGRRLLRGGAARLAPAFARVVDVYPLSRGDRPGRWWFGRPRRGVPPIEPVKASSWSVLSAHAVAEILRWDRERPDVRAFFSTMRTPDEYYVPSLARGAGLVCTQRATAWTSFPPGAASPRWVDEEVIACIVPGTQAFVRKIPAGVSPQVIAAADRLVLREQRGRGESEEGVSYSGVVGPTIRK